MVPNTLPMMKKGGTLRKFWLVLITEALVHTSFHFTAQCTDRDGSDCSRPLSYLWSIFQESQTSPLPPSEVSDFLLAGSTSQDFAIAGHFFTSRPASKQFSIRLEATNGDGARGTTLLILNINQVCPPTHLD